MKKFFALLAVGLVMMTTAIDSAEAARRMGGGMNLGRQAPALRQATPAPQAPALRQNQQSNRQNAAQQQNTAGAAANAAKPSMMRNILMGAAAALGITALLSALGISAEVGQFIMMALLVLALFFVARMVFSRLAGKRAAPAAAGYGARSREEPHYNDPNARFEAQQQPAANQSAGSAGQMMGSLGAAPGSVMDVFSRGAPAGQAEAAGLAIPEGFDKAGFEAVAKENFVKLQKAWDTGNVVEISDFTTDDFFIAVTHKLRERGSEPQSSEVINLSANLMGILQEGNENVAVVEFDGAMKISGEFEQVHERWVLVRKTDESTGWLLAGIEQVEQPS